MQRQRVTKDRGFAHRHPLVFIVVGSVLCLSIFFSKPIYDFVKGEQYIKETEQRMQMNNK